MPRIVLFALWICIACAASAARAQTPPSPAWDGRILRVAATPEYPHPPLLAYDETGQPFGFQVDLLEAIAAAEGVTLQWVTFGPADSVRAAMEAGSVSIIPLMVVDVSTSRFYSFAEGFASSTLCGFGLGEEPFLTVAGLRSMRVVATRSAVAGVLLADFGVPFESVRSRLEGLTKVLSGEADVFIDTELSGSFDIQSNQLARFITSPVLSETGQRIEVEYGAAGLPASRPELQMLQRGLAAVKASGEYMRLYDKWLARHQALRISPSDSATLHPLPGHSRTQMTRLRVGLIQSGLDDRNTAAAAGRQLGEALARDLGCPVEFVSGFAPELYHMLFRGEIDLVSFAPMTDMDLLRVDFTRPICSSPGVFVSRRGSEVEAAKTLRTGRIGAARGSPGAQWLRQAGLVDSDRVVLLDSCADVLRLISAGKLDGGVMGRLDLPIISENDESDHVRHELLPSPGMIGHYCVAVRGDNKALLWDVEDSIARLESSGELQSLLGRALPDQRLDAVIPWRLISWGVAAVSITLAAAAVWAITLRSELDRRTEGLRREEARFKAITESVPAAVYGFLQKPDGSREPRYANRRLAEWTQRIPALTAGMDVAALASCVHPDHAESFRQRLEQCMVQRSAFQQEVRVRDVHGSYRWIQITLDPLVVDEGVLWHGIMQDSTDLRMANEALAQSERNFREIFHSTHDAIVVSRLSDGRILEANEAACRMYGYEPAVMLQLHVSSLRDDTGPVPGSSGAPTVRTSMHRLQNGMTIEVESSWAVVQYEGSPALLSVHRDVSSRRRFEEQRRQLENQLMQAQKMESLGLLAGGIAHDFNNLLVGIMGNASLARSNSLSPDLNAPLDQIILTTKRASDLTNQLLAYAGKSRLTIEEIDLSAMASETVQLLGSRLSQRAQVIFRDTGRPAITMADPVQIRQIIMNLLTNASDALKEGSGFITLRTGIARFDRLYLSDTFVPSDIPEGEYAFLEIADDGCGMSPESMHRIFDPFYTTKFIGRGLGLSVALSIVQRHMGAIKVFSEPSRGTVFRLLLPVVHSKAVVVTEPKPTAYTSRVLLIHSEPLVRDAIRRILLHQGHSTSTAPSMEDARALLGPAAEFGAIFIDEAQVGTDPAKTASELRERSPGSSLIVVSESHGMSQAGDTPFDLFICKPFTTDSLLHALRSISPESGLT